MVFHVRIRRLSLALVCSWFVVGRCAPAAAQVNVEPLRQQVTVRKFGASISATTTSYAGNTRGVVFGGSALVGGRTERNFGYLDLSGDYSRLGGLVSVAKWVCALAAQFRVGASDLVGGVRAGRERPIPARTAARVARHRSTL
jgi:hypothetical protein